MPSTRGTGGGERARPGRATAPRNAAGPGTRETGSAKARVTALLTTEPGVTGGEVARRLGIDPSYARLLLRDLRGGEQGAPEHLATTS